MLKQLPLKRTQQFFGGADENTTLKDIQDILVFGHYLVEIYFDNTEQHKGLYIGNRVKS